MKNYLYNVFRSVFALEIYRDNDLERENAFKAGVKEGEEARDLRIQKLVNDKYSDRHWLVNPNNVLYVSESGLVFLNREQITKNEIKQLQEEIKYLTKCRIWSIFQDTIRHKAIEKSVMHSTNFEQVIAGKMMIHNLGIINSIIETVEKIK